MLHTQTQKRREITLYSDIICYYVIRVYEERELQEQQAREKKKLEMDNQRNRLVEQLEFEKSKDFLPKVEKWSKAVADDEEELQKLQAEEKRQMEV